MTGPVLLAVNDGVDSVRSGAGRYNNILIGALAAQVPLAVLTTAVDPNSPAANPALRARIEEMGVTILTIPNSSHLRGRFTGDREWQLTADMASTLSAGGDWRAIISSDVPFLGLRNPTGVPRVHLVHTLVDLQADHDDGWRIYEAGCFGRWTPAHGTLVTPSRFLADHLCETHPGVSNLVKVVPLAVDTATMVDPPTAPVECPDVVLTYARALPAKHLIDAISACEQVRATGAAVQLHLVAVPDPNERDHLRTLADLCTSRPWITLTDRLVADIPRRVGDGRVAAVLIPAHREPAGYGPLETYLWGTTAVPVCYPSGGLPEMIDANVTGFIASDTTRAALAAALGQAVRLSASRRERMIVSGKRMLIDRHDIRHTAGALLAIVNHRASS